MSKQSHTPGPYEFEITTDDGSRVEAVIQSIHPECGTPGGSSSHVARLEFFNDAKFAKSHLSLFAAAPEMLEALEAIMNLPVKTTSSGNQVFLNQSAEESRAFNMAGAAIAKAKGKV